MSRWTLLLILLVVVVILAFKFLPWYVLIGLAVLFILSAKFLGKTLLLWVVSMPFRAKGAVLHHATASVHALEWVAEPPPEPVTDDEDDEEDLPKNKERPEMRDYYHLDVTISPKPSAGPFHHWEIGELNLVHPDFNLMRERREELADLCEIKQREVQVNELFASDEDDDDDDAAADSTPQKSYQVGDYVPDQGYKLPGPQRLHLLLAIKPGTPRLVFQYYFEKFGEVVIPDKPAERPDQSNAR
jgi:hypothetical protein